MAALTASAQHGRGWIGHLVAKYHIQSWVQRNTPKLVGYAQSLSKPALALGKGAVSLMIELFAIFVLVLLLLLEGPKMWNWTLGQMTPGRRATVTRIAADVSQKVTGYMVGNLLTSLTAGTVVFVTLLILGVPFPLLWGLWVALVDFLPMIGGAWPASPPSCSRSGYQPIAVLVQAMILAFSRSNSSGVMTPRSRRSASLASWSAVLVCGPAASWT